MHRPHRHGELLTGKRREHGEEQRRRRRGTCAIPGSPIHGTSGRRHASTEFIPRRIARRRWMPGLASHYAPHEHGSAHRRRGEAWEAEIDERVAALYGL